MMDCPITAYDLLRHGITEKMDIYEVNAILGNTLRVSISYVDMQSLLIELVHLKKEQERVKLLHEMLCDNVYKGVPRDRIKFELMDKKRIYLTDEEARVLSDGFIDWNLGYEDDIKNAYYDEMNEHIHNQYR
jgi:hypothetical protein